MLVKQHVIVLLLLGAAFLGCDSGGEDNSGEAICSNPSCSVSMVGDGDCNQACSCAENNFDGGDCAGTCTPDCSGRACGPDGCGGDCGTCTGATTCSYEGQCLGLEAGTVTGSLSFEARLPGISNGEINLEGIEVLPAVEMLALVFEPGGEVIGGAQLDDSGQFAIPLTQPLGGGELLVFAAAWAPSLDSEEVSFAVLMPASGGEPTSTTSDLWTWHSEVPTGGNVGALVITEEQGSGALFLFLIAAASMDTILQNLLQGDESKLVSLAFLWSPGASWSCGSCFGGGYSQNVGDDSFVLDSSIWISGETGDSSCWGYPVIMHEFGHYVAGNYSRDDSPGGDHYVGQPVAPAFAWSEGFASFFAVSTFSHWIGESLPIFWDIQTGGSFWHNYDEATYSSGSDILMPDLDGGVTQNLDENAVAVMLWHLWDGVEVPETEGTDDGIALGTKGVEYAISSPRFLGADRGADGADFLDFVDSVYCGGLVDGEELADLVNNWFGFPYDGLPLCQ
jgi:hypothetical protein